MEGDSLDATSAPSGLDREGELATEATSATADEVSTAAVAALPTGFVQGIVASGLDLPTAFAFLPDGRILVALKGGVVRVIKNGALLPTPLIDISDRVNDYWDRGLIGIAADPNFIQRLRLPLLHLRAQRGRLRGDQDRSALRVTVSGDTASRSSETPILGSVVGSSCNNFPVGADCIPTDGPGHSTGAIHFAADGTMFVTAGDAPTGTPWSTTRSAPRTSISSLARCST